MGFFWIGINHTSHGLIKISSKKRLILELISGIILLISWFIIGFGIKEAVTTADSWENRDSDSVISAGFVFVVGNGSYLITTFILAIFNLIYRRDILIKKSAVPRLEWTEREKHDMCFDICNPLNGLRIFHHLEHRGAFLFNLLAMVLRMYELRGAGSCVQEWKVEGVETVCDPGYIVDNIFWFSGVLMVIKFVQTLLSYLYAEDVALCGVPILGCFHFWFIRRYPQEQSDSTTDLSMPSGENPGKYNRFENPPTYNDVVQHV